MPECRSKPGIGIGGTSCSLDRFAKRCLEPGDDAIDDRLLEPVDVTMLSTLNEDVLGLVARGL